MAGYAWCILTGPKLLTAHCTCPGHKGENGFPLYRVVLSEGAVVREGVSIDHSSQIGLIPVGTVVEALEERISIEGVVRFKIAFKRKKISKECDSSNSSTDESQQVDTGNNISPKKLASNNNCIKS